MTSYLRPRDLDEALAARAAHPDWMVLAGGTDLMVNANHREVPAGILDLWRLPAIGFVRVVDDAIAIGAGTTWHEVERHPAIRARMLPLAAAAPITFEIDWARRVPTLRQVVRVAGPGTGRWAATISSSGASCVVR